MGANRPGSESSWMQTHLGGADRSWGESSNGRIVQGADRPAFGRNVHGAKQTVGERLETVQLTFISEHF